MCLRESDRATQHTRCPQSKAQEKETGLSPTQFSLHNFCRFFHVAKEGEFRVVGCKIFERDFLQEKWRRMQFQRIIS